MAPSFWQVAGSAYRASTAHSFLLHGDGTQDYVDGTVDLVPWLKSALIKSSFDLVIEYDPANGLRFPVSSMKNLFLKEVMGISGGAPANGALSVMTGQTAQQDIDLRLSLVEALPLLDKALSLSQRRNPDSNELYRVSVIFSMADLTFPAMNIGPLPPSLAQASAYILSWLRNPVWRAANAPMIWFVAPTLSAVADVLRGAYTIAVSAPDYDERKTFAEQSIKANGVQLADGLTLHRLAAMTAGLLRLHVEDVIVKARIEDVPLTPALVKARKDEIMAARFAGVLETVEATGSLDDIAGLAYLKDYLRSEIVQPMKDGEVDGMPMGVLMAGPPGTGKTYIAEKLAASAGVNFVMLRMSNILGGIVGESEANLEKALSGIQEMTPCIVFIDEVEQQVRRDTGASGSPVAGNLFGRLLNAMGDTRNRGKVVWLMATNRPDLLDAAFKRSGRIDGKFAVMPPDDDQERAEMFRVMARKNGVTLADDVRLDEIAPSCEDYTGADIEVIVNKARKVARGHGRAEVTHEDLAYAVKTMRVNATGEAKRMIALALAEVNDLDNLPPSYRARVMAGEFEEQPATVAAEPEVMTGRTGRAFDFEA
ncbi:MAG TPA: ATP-binding protein [Aggregatilinea sp.]|uniref:ATP-binding protein n=1 Tax=Aggregatilinea sp. TaxID=2806333 RepID=UPI002B767415|nr:ATP-binding protein [Aggregatilinea sp.]HML21852.1 ATP-binding protein [Aggregatilinea sp.]